MLTDTILDIKNVLVNVEINIKD